MQFDKSTPTGIIVQGSHLFHPQCAPVVDAGDRRQVTFDSEVTNVFETVCEKCGRFILDASPEVIEAHRVAAERVLDVQKGKS